MEEHRDRQRMRAGGLAFSYKWAPMGAKLSTEPLLGIVVSTRRCK